MQEVDELRDPGQDDETFETFVYNTEGDVSRIYGSFVGNLTRGISMYIEPSEMSNPEKLKFEVEVINFSSELLSMQITFENPAYVSIMSEKDVLVVNLNDFRDQDG